jgi:dihydroflavonol-4-reductase
VVNPTFCFGPFDTKPARQVLLRVARGQMPFYPEVPVNAVDVRDVAEGQMLAAERGVPGERYLLGGRNVMFSEILAAVAQAAGVRPPRWRLPLWLGRSAALLSEVVSRIVGSAPAVPLVGMELLKHSQHVTWRKAESQLGYKPRYPFDQTFADAVAWLRESGRLPRSS